MRGLTWTFSSALLLGIAATAAAVAQPSSLSARQGTAFAVTVAALAVTLLILRARRTTSRRRDSTWSFIYQVRRYIAARGTPPAIDGDVFKAVWEKVPWSEPFMEIRGEADAPPGTQPTEAHRTRMKMLWDDEYLYIAAAMDFPAGYELIAKFTEKNSPIYHTDSDFEVFIDPAGCNHSYKELELNAINTVWNLMLTKPYANGGGERSGRIAKPGEPHFWDVKAQKTATRITHGALHSPEAPAQWCCELAIAHSDSQDLAPVRGPQPAVGNSWRINFSRVEKKGDVNWVWSPQVVWSPSDQRYVGQVNMHLPDAFGYVVFADERGQLPGGVTAEAWRDPAWTARMTATAVYYGAKAFQDKNKKAPSSYEEVDAEGLLKGAFREGAMISLMPEANGGWTITAQADGWAASITDQRLLKVRRA